MTTFAIIALTVLGTIVIFILIIGLIDAPIYDEEMYRDSILSKKAEDSQVDLLLYNFSEVTFEELKALKEIIDNELEVKYVQDFKYVGDLFNLQELKEIVSKSQNHQLKHHLNSAIRDELYELAQHIVDVAKERGITLKAEV